MAALKLSWEFQVIIAPSDAVHFTPHTPILLRHLHCYSGTLHHTALHHTTLHCTSPHPTAARWTYILTSHYSSALHQPSCHGDMYGQEQGEESA